MDQIELTTSNTRLLEITALKSRARIGIYAWEQRIFQDVFIDIHFSIHILSEADQITSTLDYDEICKHVVNGVESRSFALIETLAEFVASLLKTKYPRIKGLSVRVSKPQANPSAKNISITVQHD